MFPLINPPKNILRLPGNQVYKADKDDKAIVDIKAHRALFFLRNCFILPKLLFILHSDIVVTLLQMPLLNLLPPIKCYTELIYEHTTLSNNMVYTFSFSEHILQYGMSVLLSVWYLEFWKLVLVHCTLMLQWTLSSLLSASSISSNLIFIVQELTVHCYYYYY